MSDDFDPGHLDDLGDDAGPDDIDWFDDLGDEGADALDEPLAPGDDPDEVDPSGDFGDPDVADLDDREIDLAVDESGPDPAGLDADTDAETVAGELDGDVLHAALVEIGADEAAEVIAGFVDDGVGLEPRTAVAALDAVGIAARVEHADIGTLVETVASGGDILLLGADTPHAVVAVDVDAGVVHLEADGVRSTVSLHHLADAWADLDHEVLVLAEPANGAVRLAGDSLLLAVDPTELGDRSI